MRSGAARAARRNDQIGDVDRGGRAVEGDPADRRSADVLVEATVYRDPAIGLQITIAMNQYSRRIVCQCENAIGAIIGHACCQAYRPDDGTRL